MEFREWLGRTEALLNEDYRTSVERFVRENPSVGRETVQRYVDEFRKIVGKKYRQIADPLNGVSVPTKARTNVDAYPTFHELETVVDYVKGQVDVSGEMKLDGPDIDVAAAPVYEDGRIVVYRADSPRACIAYRGSVPYSWCISRNDSQNMYHAYRFKEHEPAFYFVKNKEKTRRELESWNLAKTVFSGKFRDPWHFFVVQVSKNKGDNPDSESKDFIVTSANNDGDSVITWKEMLEREPLLAPLHRLFEPRPLEGDEKKQYDRFVKGVGDEEFARMTYAEKSRFLDIYPSMDRPLSDSQWELLPADLKNKYLGFGVGLGEEQYESIKGDRKALARYREISDRKIKNLASSKEPYKFKHVKNSELDACSFESFKTFVDKGGMPTEIPSDKEKREYWSAGVAKEAQGVMDKWDKMRAGRDLDWWPDWDMENATEQKKRRWPNWSNYDEDVVRQGREGKRARWRAAMANAKGLNLRDAPTAAIHRLMGGYLDYEEISNFEEFDPDDEENQHLLDDQKPAPFEDHDDETGEDKAFFPTVSLNSRAAKKFPETQSFVEEVIRQKGNVPPALATILIFYSPDWRRTIRLLGHSVRRIGAGKIAYLVDKSVDKEISDYFVEHRNEFPESEYLDLMLVVHSSDQSKSWNALGMSEKINDLDSYSIMKLLPRMDDEVQKMLVRDCDFRNKNQYGFLENLFRNVRDKEALAEKILGDPETRRSIGADRLIDALKMVKKEISPRTLERFKEILSGELKPDDRQGRKGLESLVA